MNSRDSLYIARTLDDAVAALAERGREGASLAGATWIMRAPLRKQRHDLAYVALTRIEALRQVEIYDHEIGIGACVTHAQLAAALTALPDCIVLAQAAGHSANPAIRRVATVGGNLSTIDFAAADLVPALIALDAQVELSTSQGTERLPIDQFLARRPGLGADCLLTRVIVPRKACRSAHIRLPLRKAGDYPVAIVSLAAEFALSGSVDRIRIAVGSVEASARRWSALEAALIGQPLDAFRAAEQAERHAETFDGRDGIEAPGWYRVKVLPSLVRRAVQALQQQVRGGIGS